jgi:16S rRNA (cytosine967-C5)-methyltransferase
MITITAPLLAASADALKTILSFAQPADMALTRWFGQHRSGSRDRRVISEVVFTVLRRYRTLQRHSRCDTLENSSLMHRRLVLLALIRYHGLSVRQLSDAISKEEQEWVKTLKADRPMSEQSCTMAEQADFPEWLMASLLQQMPAPNAQALAQALNVPASLDLRVNTLKTSREAVLARLREEGLVAQPGAFSPLAIRVQGRPSLIGHPLLAQGDVEVQDEGSQLIGLLLSPRRGDMVADFCAGAGGKTLLLGALMHSTGRLYALDTSAARLARLKPRLARSGLSNVHPLLLAHENDTPVKRLAGKMDCVLVDAPCSGLGTLRRNPDLKWRQTPQGIMELSALQLRILKAASRLVKPGGRLLYATCSILDDENSAVVNAFLAQSPQFCRQDMSAQCARWHLPLNIDAGGDLSLNPLTHGTDGFYAALLHRQP